MLNVRNVVASVVLLALGGTAQPALIDRGEGFIYDDVLDITWTQNANINGADTWDNQVAWAAGYSQTHSVYGAFEDWRLPSMDVNRDGTLVDCSTASEVDCRDNEYGYLYYQYGIVGWWSPGDFMNLQPDYYWSSTGQPLDAWVLDFNLGYAAFLKKYYSLYAWAVRDGDIAPVPVPAAAWLLSGALGLLGGLRAVTNRVMQN